MRRLYVHIYLVLIASLALVVLTAGTFWRYSGVGSGAGPAAAVAETIVAQILPPAGRPPAEQQAALARLVGNQPIRATLFDAGGTLVASTGTPLAPPAPGASGWTAGERGPPVWVVDLPDGRALAVQVPTGRRHPGWALVGFLALVAVAVALAAYPLTRWLTRRVERLQGAVDALGRGDLAARVPVEGHDEVASLATSFNRAAGRIEALVGAQKRLLANASHELRSPLARIRMALALPEDTRSPEIARGIERDIGELDALIDEILLASRLETLEALESVEPVDFFGVVVEECSRVDVVPEGVAATLSGDPRLLRRLVRNLLENARRHGAGSPIEVHLASAGGVATLAVDDRGPGVPEAERERIFEAFYRPAGSRELGSGYGLGLALVRQIAAKHAGTVHCEARAGGGSRFVVRLPLAAPAEGRPATSGSG